MGGALRSLVVLAAAAYVAAFLVAAVFRLSYPFPLNTTEAPALEQVLRVLRGQPLYSVPTLEHVPFIYGPVYFYAAAAVAWVTGPSFAALRLTSLLGSAVSLLVLYRLVRWETGSGMAGLVAAGLFAASYPLSEDALDIGRVDALFVGIVLLSVYAARVTSVQLRPNVGVLAVSGALIALAGLTKLPLAAGPIGLAVFAYLVWAVRARSLAFVLGAALTFGAILVLLVVQCGPWATWYLWDLPNRHELHRDLLERFWFADFLPRFTLPLLLGPLFVVGRLLQGDRRPLVLYGLVCAALLAVTWASRSGPGGARNVLVPAHAVAAMLFGLGLHAALRELRPASLRANVYQAYVLGVCTLQFALLWYNPRLQVPYRSDQWADERLAATLAGLPGPILAPDLDGYLLGSDKGEQPHLAAAGELMGGYGGGQTTAGLELNAEMQAALKQHRYRYVVMVDPVCCWPIDLVQSAGYRDLGSLFPPGDVFYAWKSQHTPEAHLYAAPD